MDEVDFSTELALPADIEERDEFERSALVAAAAFMAPCYGAPDNFPTPETRLGHNSNRNRYNSARTWFGRELSHEELEAFSLSICTACILAVLMLSMLRFALGVLMHAVLCMHVEFAKCQRRALHLTAGVGFGALE